LNVLACTNTPSDFPAHGSGVDGLKLSNRQRVLCCAPTNVAVQEIARKMIAKCFRADLNAVKFEPHEQFASLLSPEYELALDQLVLVGVAQSIEPFGLEFEEKDDIAHVAEAGDVDEAEEADEKRLDSEPCAFSMSNCV
jgi:hypothetical protein